GRRRGEVARTRRGALQNAPPCDSHCKEPWMKTALMRVLCALLLLTNAAFAADPLPSWNDTAPKKAIIAFVDKVTRQGSPDFVPVAERIATFDNDGTLWAEQPMYFQFLFVADRVKALAPPHPE